MNKTPRTRLVTLMAAAAGVTAALGSSMSAPDQALARTSVVSMMADTVKTKAAATATKSTTAKKSTTATKTSAAAKGKAAAPAKTADAKKAGAKGVVSTAAPSLFSENDACGSEEDCRNADGAGH